MPFGGQTYDPAQDKDRLTRQLWAVKNLMADGKWRTLAAITEVVEAPQQSVSARLRDFRKEKFGSHTVDRRSMAGAPRGVYEYRLTLNSAPYFSKYLNASEVDDSYTGLLAWDVAKGDKPLQEAIDWLTEHGGMDRQKALSILLKKVWRLL